MGHVKKQRFLIELHDRGILDRLLPILNWLLMDEAFSDKSIWTAANVARFTKQFKSAVGFKKDAFKHEGGLAYFKSPASRHSALVMMSSGDSEGRDLVRHVRNSIAHGFARLYDSHFDCGGFIEFLDFRHAGGKQRGSTNQSALIVLSVIDLEMLYCCYRDIEISAGKSVWVSQTRIG